MTRERRLAVQMWREIAERIKSGDKKFSVMLYKAEFCQKHGLTWLNNCYFCQYASEFCYSGEGGIILNCDRCPLKSCEKGSMYDEVLNSRRGKSHKMAVKIADILEGVKNEV